jgi:hypothetical protein
MCSLIIFNFLPNIIRELKEDGLAVTVAFIKEINA